MKVPEPVKSGGTVTQLCASVERDSMATHEPAAAAAAVSSAGLVSPPSPTKGNQEAPLEETDSLMADVVPKLRHLVKAERAKAESTTALPPDEVLCMFLRGCKYNPEKAAKVR